MYRIVITKSSNITKKQHWFWKIVRNGRVLAHSELYSAHNRAYKTANELFSALGRSKAVLVDSEQS